MSLISNPTPYRLTVTDKDDNIIFNKFVTLHAIVRPDVLYLSKHGYCMVYNPITKKYKRISEDLWCAKSIGKVRCR